jgi:hypothetical protein
LEAYVESGNDVKSLSQNYVSPDGFALGVWINGIRQSYKKGFISEARIKSLEEIEGWAWDHLDASWNLMFEELVAFKRKKSNLQIPKDYSASNGTNLKSWTHLQRSRYKKNQLSDSRVSKLESLSPEWKWVVNEDKWEIAFSKLQTFVSIYDSVTVPNNYRESDGYLLRSWIQKQRSEYSKGKLNEEKVAKLESVHPSWLWDPHTDRWHQNYDNLKLFLEINKGLNPSQNLKSKEEKSLSSWLERQRALYRQSSLRQDLVLLLESLPNFEWEPREDSWMTSFNAYTREVEARGTFKISQKFVDKDRISIGVWINIQRTQYRKGLLTADRINLLESSHPDWTWEPYEQLWEVQFEVIRAHHTQFGEFPRISTQVAWMERQRKNYKQGKLPIVLIKKLEDTFIDWSWNPRSDNWSDAISNLNEFISKNGHSRIAVGYRTKEGFSLGNWVKYQRFLYRKGTLNNAHIVSLEKVKGWSWNSAE